MERISVPKLVLSAVVAVALAILPASVKAQGEYSDGPAQSGKSTAKRSSGETKTQKKEKKDKEKKELSKGQIEARERQRKCAAEWQDAKTKGTLEKGITWAKFWSACNTRLKQQGA